MNIISEMKKKEKNCWSRCGSILFFMVFCLQVVGTVVLLLNVKILELTQYFLVPEQSRSRGRLEHSILLPLVLTRGRAARSKYIVKYILLVPVLVSLLYRSFFMQYILHLKARLALRVGSSSSITQLAALSSQYHVLLLPCDGTQQRFSHPLLLLNFMQRG